MSAPDSPRIRYESPVLALYSDVLGFEVKKDTELTEEQLLAAGEVVIGRMDIIADKFKRLDAGETKDTGPLYDIKAQIAYWSVASAVREIRANRAA